MLIEKIEAGEPESQSADLQADNLAQLRKLFPELVTEGAKGPAINIDVLKGLVGDATVIDADEKYGLTCVFRDSAFENDVAKSNLAAILEQYGIAKVRSL